MGEGFLLALENPKPRINLGDRFRHASGNDPVSPPDQIMLQAGAGQIEGTSLTCSTQLERRVLRVDGPDSGQNLRLQHANLIADRN